MRVPLRRACLLVAACPLAACWLTASFDNLVDGGPTSGGGDSSPDVRPEAGPDGMIVVTDGGAESGVSDGGTIDGAADVADAADSGTVPADAGCLVSSYTESIAADRPLAYWRLDEPAGSTLAVDQEGTYAGTYEGGVVLGVPGVPGIVPADTAASFDGTSGVVNVGNQLAFLAKAPFSVEAWIEPTTVDAVYRGVVSNESPTQSPRYGYLLYVKGQPDASTLAGFERWDNAMSDPTVVANAWTANTWSHVVGTFTDTPDAGDPYLALYVNGARVDAYFNSPVSISQGNTFLIGALFSGAIPSFFHGTIDEVAVYDHALSPRCVLAHYHLGMGMAP